MDVCSKLLKIFKGWQKEKSLIIRYTKHWLQYKVEIIKVHTHIHTGKLALTRFVAQMNEMCAEVSSSLKSEKQTVSWCNIKERWQFVNGYCNSSMSFSACLCRIDMQHTHTANNRSGGEEFWQKLTDRLRKRTHNQVQVDSKWTNSHTYTHIYTHMYENDAVCVHKNLLFLTMRRRENMLKVKCENALIVNSQTYTRAKWWCKIVGKAERKTTKQLQQED